MNQAIAFAPGDISCLFRVISDPLPEKMHSLGMSFTITEGVTATATKVASNEPGLITFNNEAIQFPTVIAAIAKLTDVTTKISLKTQLPLSCGFGLSGASTLAALFAINHLHDLKKSAVELALLAHIAEVENLTGLGDVCAQFHGGCLAKFTPGDPLGAEEIMVGEVPVFYRNFGPLHTDEVLKDAARKERINRAGTSALIKLQELLKSTGNKPRFSDLINISLGFSEQSELIQDQRVRDCIDQILEQGSAASMIMLGNAVFSDTNFQDAVETKISRHKARVIEAA